MAADETEKAKAQVRRIVAESLVRLTPSHRRAASIEVAQRLMSLPSVRDARTIMVFLSLPTEIDTWPAIRWAWQENKRVVVPRIEAAGPEVPLTRRAMVAVVLRRADVDGVALHPDVRPGALGILEVPGAPPVEIGDIDVLLMPCQAVDRAGNRLGKGGGFFDRLLARRDMRAERIVLAFREQVLDEVPVTPTDRPVDRIVTDAEVLTFNRPGKVRKGVRNPTT
jgi:5-formyltetrahydrofolate cyclo-ligase